MKPSEATLKIQDLDHCGIVAGIIDQLGLVEIINQKIPTHPQEIVSAGVGVKAMILNRLGLVSAPYTCLNNSLSAKPQSIYWERGFTRNISTMTN